MCRFTCCLVFLVLTVCALSSSAQSGPPALEAFFTGTEVVLKIDMSGSQKGVDLRFNKPAPMDGRITRGASSSSERPSAKATLPVLPPSL